MLDFSNFDVTVEIGYPTTVKGSDKELRRVKDYLDSEGFECDNNMFGQALGGVPDSFGTILVCDDEEENTSGYLVISNNEDEKQSQADKILGVARDVLILSQCG